MFYNSESCSHLGGGENVPPLPKIQMGHLMSSIDPFYVYLFPFCVIGNVKIDLGCQCLVLVPHWPGLAPVPDRVWTTPQPQSLTPL